MTDFDAPWERPDWIQRSRLLLDSYEHWLNTPLVERSGDARKDSQQLWEAPFVVVAHGTEVDPILNYGNRTALALWEMDLDTFLRTPSRKTAEPVHRDERARMLKQTADHGYIDDYQGIRIAASGRRFRIDRAVVWNVIGEEDERVGQAAAFSHWTFLD